MYFGLLIDNLAIVCRFLELDNKNCPKTIKENVYMAVELFRCIWDPFNIRASTGILSRTSSRPAADFQNDITPWYTSSSRQFYLLEVSICVWLWYGLIEFEYDIDVAVFVILPGHSIYINQLLDLVILSSYIISYRISWRYQYCIPWHYLNGCNIQERDIV